MPIPIKFGTKKKHFQSLKMLLKIKSRRNRSRQHHQQPNPAWTKQPTELTDEDYKNFYHELYPMQFEEPLFNIHLNVDYPFNLTGILYFPKIRI
jgi:molecular chaperone HtpG